jgi:hypothetical protein
MYAAPYANASDTPGGETTSRFTCGLKVDVTDVSGEWAKVEVVSGRPFYIPLSRLSTTAPSCG